MENWMEYTAINRNQQGSIGINENQWLSEKKYINWIDVGKWHATTIPNYQWQMDR